MSVEQGKGFWVWETYRGLLDDRTSYCFLKNETLERNVGLIVRGFDKIFSTERILALPLDDNQLEPQQILYEYWTKVIFEGKVTITLVDVVAVLARMGISPDRIIDGGLAAELGKGISGYLGHLKDSSWREIAIEVLTTQQAETLHREWFV